MSDRQLEPSTVILIKARDYISDKSRWCPEGLGEDGYYDAAGTGVKQVCAIISLYLAQNPEYNPRGNGTSWPNYNNFTDPINKARLAAENKLEAVANELFGKLCVVSVNKLGHEAVLRMFDRAISNDVSKGVA